MLKLLHIENIAVIEKADIEFTGGLNVLTGETGAGKSIVIDALSAAIGARTSRDILRTGAESASVTAVFSCGGSGVLPDWVEPDENGEIFIMRKIAADGKSTCRVNGAPVQNTMLRELGAALLDVHGQNDGRKLLDESAHLQYLDAFGGLVAELSQYRTAYDAFTAKKREIDRLTMDEAEKERRVDSLKFKINEIEQAKLQAGELRDLSNRREMLRNASKLTESVETAFEALYGGEGNSSDAASHPGAVALISSAGAALDNASRYSQQMLELSRRLSDISYTAQDISEELRDFRASLDFTPDELDSIEERLDTIKRVTRKYAGTAPSDEAEAEVLEQLECAKNELDDIGDASNKLVKLSAEFETCLAQAKKKAAELSEQRKGAAQRLSRHVKEELEQLNMPGVKFMVEFESVGGEYALCESGCDEVRYLMSANAGETPGRINRIASGGELARIMLALKNVLGSTSDTASMVFDEIDTGVSGIAAQRVGEKLAALAKDRQVLCVTHLPQIAVMADTHFSISKSVSGGRTFTYVEQLDAEGRRCEIARLTGGENITDTTLKSAGEQLKAAEEYKKMRM